MRRSTRPGTWRSCSRILSGDLVVGRDVVALDLHVDRRGQAEIQDLGHDVGGQEIERRAGELARQLAAQLADVIGGRVMVLA